MRSWENPKTNREEIYLEILIECPGQPVELTSREIQSIPSTWMKATEYRKLFLKLEWAPQPGTSAESVLITHLKALKRRHKVIDYKILEPLTLNP